MHTWVKWYLVGPYYIWSGRAKHFTNKLKPNQKSKLSFYTLYHSDVVIKRLQPLLSHKPFSKSKPLGFNFLYFPFENKHLLPPETLSLAQHPFQYWLILKSSIPSQKSTVMNHGGCTGVAPSLGSEAGGAGGNAGAGEIMERLPTLPRRAWWYWKRGHGLYKKV